MMPLGGFFTSGQKCADVNYQQTPWAPEEIIDYSGGSAAWNPAVHAGPITASSLWSPVATFASWNSSTALHTVPEMPADSGAQNFVAGTNGLMGFFFPVAMVSSTTNIPSANSVQHPVQSSTQGVGRSRGTKADAELRYSDRSRAASCTNSSVRGRVQTLAFDTCGCLQVEKELVSASESDQVAIAHELRGSVRMAALHPHAYLVLKKVVEILPLDSLSFAIEELVGHGLEIAKSRHGSLVMVQLLKRCQDALDQRILQLVSAMVMELAQQAPSLSRHEFGHQVMSTVFDHGSNEDRSLLLAGLKGHLARLSRNCSGSRIVQKAFERPAVAEREAMADEFVRDSCELVLLAQHRFGRHIVKMLSNSSERYGQDVRTVIADSSCELRATKYGARLLTELERAVQQTELERQQAERKQAELERKQVQLHKPVGRWADEEDDDAEFMFPLHI